MKLFNLFHQSPEEVEASVAKEIAKGHGKGRNVAELQQSLNEYKKGNDSSASGMFKALFRYSRDK